MPVTLRGSDGVSYRFDPGALCLEFVTTGGSVVYPRYELLHEPADLSRWTAESRLGLDRVETTPEQLGRAKALRAALWRMAADRANGRATAPADVAADNEAARLPPPVPEMDEDGRTARLAPATGDQAVSAIARDAIDLFTGPYADRMRECAGYGCHLLFVDTSRPGRRRWCSMERCGNRDKVRRHRAQSR
ncbi:CGNR zinc finger domain-containing protein [Microbispora corallina]|uniref:CGNR zinc finger domain-containing protein n=1 Tax=Microbispora corallina TaxID=83302 RepID=UPI0031D96BAD